LGIEYGEISERAAKLPEPIAVRGSRLVVHIQTEDQAVDDLLALLKTITEEKKTARSVPPPLAKGNSTAAGSIYQEIYRR
jgi:threonine aldolase